MCALALLTVATARPPGTVAPWATASPHISDRTTDQPGHWRDTGKLPARPGEAPPRDAGLVRITVPEARRLFALLTPPANQVSEIFRDAWSIWRRRHQARAPMAPVPDATPSRRSLTSKINTERLAPGKETRTVVPG